MAETTQGILTETQRDWLRSENPREEYTSQQRYRRRTGVQHRLTNAMADFRLLFREFPDEELGKIFGEDIDEVDSEDDELGYEQQLSTHIKSAIAFFARASDLEDDQIYPGLEEQPALQDFIEHTEGGIETWLIEDKDMVADVSVSIKIDNIRPVEEYRNELEERDEPLTRPERLDAKVRLQRAGYSHDEIADILGEVPDDLEGQ